MPAMRFALFYELSAPPGHQGHQGFPSPQKYNIYRINIICSLSSREFGEDCGFCIFHVGMRFMEKCLLGLLGMREGIGLLGCIKVRGILGFALFLGEAFVITIE